MDLVCPIWREIKFDLNRRPELHFSAVAWRFGLMLYCFLKRRRGCCITPQNLTHPSGRERKQKICHSNPPTQSSSWGSLRHHCTFAVKLVAHGEIGIFANRREHGSPRRWLKYMTATTFVRARVTAPLNILSEAELRFDLPTGERSTHRYLIWRICQIETGQICRCDACQVAERPRPVLAGMGAIELNPDGEVGASSV